MNLDAEILAELNGAGGDEDILAELNGGVQNADDDILAELSRPTPTPVVMPEEEALFRENLPDQGTIRMPTPPTSGEQLDEIIGQVKEGVPSYLKLVGRMAPPIVAGTAASMLIPAVAPGVLGAAITGAASGAVGGLATRGVSNLMDDKPVFEGTTPGQVALDLGLGGAFGAGIAGLKNLVATRAAAPAASAAGEVAALPGFDEAITLRSPLPKLPKVPGKHNKTLTIASDAMDLPLIDKLRTGATSAAFKLRRSADLPSKMAGERLEGVGALTRELRQQSHRAIEGTGLRALPEEQRKAVTVVLSGKGDLLPTEYKSQEILDVAQRVRDDLYDAAAVKMQQAGVKTISIEKGKEFGKAKDFVALPDYSPSIPAASTAPRKIKLAQILGQRRRPPQALMQRRGTEYEPWQQALDELNGVDGPRPWRTDALDIADRYITGGQGRVGFVDAVARSHFFGAPKGKAVQGATYPWGADANKLHQRMLESGDHLNAKLFQKSMDRLYRPPKTDDFDSALDRIRDGISNLMLGQTALTQIPQTSTNIWRYGAGNTVKGIRQYRNDPSYRLLTDISGAKEAGFAEEMAKGTIPQRWMQRTEGALRGWANAGVKPYTENLIREVQAGNLTAANVKKLAELGLTVDEARGGMTAGLLKKAIEAGAHRNQFHPNSPGQSGDWFMSPTGRLVSQFQPFSHSAWRLGQEDILEPLFGRTGWQTARRTGDYSLQALGAARAGRQLMAGVPASIGTEALKSVAGLREFDPGNVVGGYASTHYGLPGQGVGYLFGGDDPTRSVTVSPLAGLVQTEAQNLKGGHLERILYDLLAAKDPTGIGPLLRPTFYNLTREE